jgi:hypothetical protein
MVSSGNMMQAILPPGSGAHTGLSASRQNLAYGNDLMFDHTMRVAAPRNLW